MSKTWKNGDIIVAEDLNTIENRITQLQSDLFIMTQIYNQDQDSISFDKTAAEILNALNNKNIIMIKRIEESVVSNICVSVWHDGNAFIIDMFGPTQPFSYTNDNDYPKWMAIRTD